MNDHNGEPRPDDRLLNIEAKLFKAAKTAGRTSEEKARGLERLTSYMNSHPLHGNTGAGFRLPEDPSVISPFHPSTLSPSRRSWIQILDLREYVFSHKVAAFLVVLTLIVCAGKGMVIASRSAVPGSALYPFKIYTYEKVQSLLALNPRANAEVDVEHATVRLQEAEQLAAQGKLDTTTEMQVTAAFKASADQATAKAKELRDNGDIDVAALISSDLESSLASHKNILNRLSLLSGIASSTLEPIINLVDSSLSSTTEDRSSSEDLVATSSNVDFTKTAAKQAHDDSQTKIDQASRVVNQAKKHNQAQSQATPSDDVQQSASDQLKQAQDLVNQGNDNFNNGKYGDAYLLYGKANRSADQASLEVKLHGSINGKKGR